jgi:hypothetical protein
MTTKEKLKNAQWHLREAAKLLAGYACEHRKKAEALYDSDRRSAALSKAQVNDLWAKMLRRAAR